MPWQRAHAIIPSLPGSRPTGVRIDGRPVVLVDVAGSIHAVEDRCSHAGCAFSEDGFFDGRHLVCDCHGSEFDAVSGAVIRPPAHRPIQTYRVRVTPDGFEVDLP